MRSQLLLLSCVAAACSAWGATHTGKTALPDRELGMITHKDSRLAYGNIPAHTGSATAAPERLGENNPLVPPFCETFDNFRQGMYHEDFARYFQVIDANGDKRSWGLYNVIENRPCGRCAYMLYPISDDVTKADDWLVSRAVRMEAGKYYWISIDASLYLDDEGDGPQTFEVRCGMYNDPEGMNTVVIPATDVSSSKFRKSGGWFIPRLSGTYYIGVHGISRNFKDYYNYLFIDNIAVDSPRESTVPGEVTDISMSNDPNGTTRVDISFRAPRKDISGKDLTGNVTVKVMRDGSEIRTFENVSPGAECTLSDTPATDGEHTWALRASNGAGDGADVYHVRYAGIAAPLPPVIVRTEETADHGVRYIWTKPDTDINGMPINKDMLRFNIYDVAEGYPVSVATGIDAEEYTVAMPEAQDRQVFTTFVISATFNGKESAMISGEMIPVGPPDNLPYRNSFTMVDYDRYLLSVENKPTATWRFLDDLSYPTAQDGDNGYIAMISNIPGETCEMQTGKISFAGAAEPFLSFYTYVYEFDENEINIKVIDRKTGAKTTVKKVELLEYTRPGWNKVVVPLDGYAGKEVLLILEGVIVTHGYIPVDNLIIEQLPATDFAVGELNYPRGIKPGEKFEIEATVHNWGSAKTGDYTVSLLRDGKTVDTAKGLPIESLSKEMIMLEDCLEAVSSPKSNYTVEINIAGDAHPEDNVSDIFTIDMIVPTFPAVTDLKYSGSGSHILLEWTEPDLSKGGPEEEKEDFESYEAFDTSLGGRWIMADMDKGYVGGFQDLDMPLTGTQQAWWVMNASGLYGFIMPYSGDNALVQMYSISEDGRSEIPCDDWLISPELYGGCQTISFMASSLTGDYGYETMEVYSSMGSVNPADFKIEMDECEVPSEWTQYYVYLPAGTRRFAIRATTPAGYMLKLDDISFVPAGNPVALELKGYNVYRNGELQNSEPISETSFTTSQTGDKDSYFVTAVYDRGESIASNIVGFGVGIVSPVIDDQSPVEYYNLQGLRVNPDWLVPGIYVRRRGLTTDKIIIR